MPDFRGDKDGFWKKNSPVHFSEFKTSKKARLKSWENNIAIQNKIQKAKPTKNKSKSKPKCNAVPFNVDRLVSDKKDEIAKVEKITGYTAYIINSKQYKREVVRFDTKRKVEQSDGSDVNQPVTAITAYYVKGKGWRDAISPRKSAVTYYDTLEMLVTSCGYYRNKINDSVESFRDNIYQRIDIIKQLDHLYSMT